jgi:DNA helicase-2/ATP-dependent DNA helicase PcrA
MSRESVERFRAAVDLQIDYAAELNPQQHAAVTAVPGPSLVIAGAGSGKTRTLTYRVAFLLEQGIPPERILLLTFTNKAAREMMRRVTDLIGRELRELWGGTFHSIGARFLRRHAEAAGYKRDFTILDREDATDVLKGCLAELGMEPKITGIPKADVVGELISMASNTRCEVREVLQGEYEGYARFAEPLTRLAEAYTTRKRDTNVMDFDDLLFLSWRALQENTELREYYQRRFQFILVDEYQDTNRLQSDWIDLLAERHKNVMAVGDDAQSIYSWRGADCRNILEFPRRYPGARVYKIESNYRSTPEILAVANAAIAANVHQFPKNLEAQRRTGPKPVLVVCGDAREQAGFVTRRAAQLREEGVSLGRMAVLYRSHFHALDLQFELTRQQLPFTITSGLRFFEQAHIKDVAAYLKLLFNPKDEAAFLRLVRMLPGVGEKGSLKLWRAFAAQALEAATSATVPGDQAAPTQPTPANETESHVEDGGSVKWASAFTCCLPAVVSKAKEAWTELGVLLDQLETARDQGPMTMIQCVLEGGYEEYLMENYVNHRNRLEDLQSLSEFAARFTGLEQFLTQLSLLSDVDGEEASPRQREEGDSLRLSTVHQAKGLEFDVVFVITLCEGAFPASRSVRTREGEEEERRLFYVAITRARNELYLSFPLVYSGAGLGGMSRFLGEIPNELVQHCELHSYLSYG